MQGWQLGKGLTYLRPIFQLTKLAFLIGTRLCSGGGAEEAWSQSSFLMARAPARAALKKNTITAPKI